ncbi:hypothetical protein ACOME3_002210 [Neoechinorhynchus agilis]
MARKESKFLSRASDNSGDEEEPKRYEELNERIDLGSSPDEDLNVDGKIESNADEVVNSKDPEREKRREMCKARILAYKECLEKEN